MHQISLASFPKDTNEYGLFPLSPKLNVEKKEASISLTNSAVPLNWNFKHMGTQTNLYAEQFFEQHANGFGITC